MAATQAPTHLRRATVTLGVIALLFAGALAIRSAAGWTGQSQPLAEQPPDTASLVAQLLDEQARAQLLADQLEQAAVRTQELQSALATATKQAADDARSATHLADRLDAARAKLLDLRAQLAQAAGESLTVPVAAVGAAPGDDPEDDDDDDHEDDD